MSGILFINVLYSPQNNHEAPIQGILSEPVIAGYEWVPARIGRFYKDKIFFS